MAEKSSTKKNESHSIGNRILNMFRSPGSEHSTERTHQSPQHPGFEYSTERTHQSPQHPGSEYSIERTHQSPQHPGSEYSTERTHQSPQRPGSEYSAERTHKSPQRPGSEYSTERTHQSPQRPKPQYTANGGSSGANGTQTQTLTLTKQIQQRLPTLILKLKEHKEQLMGKSEKEQEEYMQRHIESFRQMLLRNIDEFQAIVLSARPPPNAVNDPDYAQQKEAYCELLKVATGLMSNMQATLNTVLTQYRLFIEDLWEAICTGKDPSPIATRFQQQTEAYMKQSWDPVFDRADKMKEEIEKSKNSNGHK